VSAMTFLDDLRMCCQFQEGVGENPIGISALLSTPNDLPKDIQALAQKISAQGHAYEKWASIITQEQRKVISSLLQIANNFGKEAEVMEVLKKREQMVEECKKMFSRPAT